MINKNDADAYMSIKAPDSLKNRLLNELKNKSNRFSATARTFYALAAALLLIIAVYAFYPNAKQANVYCNGMPLDQNAVVVKTNDSRARISPMSAIETVAIPISIETDSKTELYVSCGTLSKLSRSGEKALKNGAKISSDTNLIWSVELEDGKATPTLTVKTKKGEVEYHISRNTINQWVLFKK